ncbi:MAG: dTDP-4-dehydrorhamnose reductase [Patescibacteria group bacterium]
MRILIIGAKGMLGNALAKVFKSEEHELTLWDKEEIDITVYEEVENKIKFLQPELIINSAAFNAVDEAERIFELAKAVNVDGPINIAKVAQQVGAVFVHYSSDYVFSGDKTDGYREYDLPNPVSKYGESKFLGEEISEHNDASYLIRTSRLFGPAGNAQGAKKSFVEIMLKLAKEKDSLDVVHDEKSSPTYVVDLAEATKELIMSGNYLPGIYHLTNAGACTWFEFAQEIFLQAGRDLVLNPVSGAQFPRPAKRPASSVLLNTKVKNLRPWQEALTDFLKEIKEYKNLELRIKNEELRIQNLELKEENIKDSEFRIQNPELEKQDNEILKEKKISFSIKINSEKSMKGILLSGGRGTRLYPLTRITSKQLLPVYNKPMIMYPLQTLLDAGIKNILIIVAPEYAGQYLHLLGSGKEFGAKFTYEIQDEPKGLPEAFIIGEKFIGEDNVALILGDNLFFDHNFSEDIKSFDKGGRIFAVDVPDPERFGVVEFDKEMKVVSIEEKPKEPKSHYAIPGVYIYDSRVCGIAKKIKPIWRPETDIVEVHKAYLQSGELDVRKIHGRWYDAGTFDSLLKASNIAATLEFQKKMGYNEEVK